MAYSDIVNNLNPIHYWRLEGNSNDTGTGTTLNGTDTNMEWGTDSVVLGVTDNASFNLDGSIDIASSSDLDDMTTTKKTISVWLKPTLNTLAFSVVNIGDTTSGLYLCIAAGLVPMVGIVDSSDGDVFYGTAVRLNEPVHLLLEYDEGSVKLYQDGILTIDETSSKTSISSSTAGSSLGKEQSIRIGGTTFTSYDLHSKMSNVAIWNSVLSTQDKLDLFTEGRQAVTRTLYFSNLPEKTEVRVYDLDNNLSELGGVEFIDNITGPNLNVDFSVDENAHLRIVLNNVESRKLPFNVDKTLGRKDYYYDGDLLLEQDYTYDNDWEQPIPLSLVTSPYLTGKTGEGEVLTCNPGEYTGSGTFTRTYQWYRDGNPISGETSTTYTIQAGDIDLPIFCREHVDNGISTIDADTKSRTWMNVKLYAIYEENTGGLIPNTSFATVNFGNEITNINNEFSNDNGTYTLPEGDFLIIATMKYQDDSNGRVDPEGRIVYSGSGNDAPIYGSGYSRDSNNKISWVRSTSYIYNASAGDTVKFEHRSDSDAMTGGSIAEYCHIQIINMTPDALLLANDENDTGAYGGTTWNTIAWDNTIASNGTSISKSGNTFTLAANKDYLISYGIAFANSSSNRTQRVSKAQIGGNDIPTSFSYAYMRNSANEYGDIGNMFMYRTGSSDETLELFAQRGDALKDGTTVRRTTTSCVFILDVTGANYCYYKDTVAGQSVNTTADLPLTLAETEVISSADLSKTSDTKLTCQKEGYWIMGSSAFVNNDAHSGTTRLTRGMKFVINGVSQKVGESGSYQRNDQSSTDTWDMAMGTVGIYHLLEDDEIEFVSFDAGQDGNSTNSKTVANKCGFWALDINSI